MGEVNPKRKPGSAWMLLLAALVVYLSWLTWLGYVAWINTQAGNQ